MSETRTLVDVLREQLADDHRVASFQLMGEDLVLVPGSHLAAVGDAYRHELERLHPSIRGRFEVEQGGLLREAHGWLRRYNRSLHGRIAGYLELGRRVQFEYPWPVVAILGICQVMTGFARTRLYGLLGPAATRVGYRTLEHLIEGTDDVLRRTNRGIFADSVPTVLMALRAHDLRARGEHELALALLTGPLPPVMDEQSRGLARALYDGLAIPERRDRFVRLSELTLEHFGREQAIFTYQMHASSDRGRATRGFLRSLTALRAVPAPVVTRGWRGRRVVFRPFTLPLGFDIRDHEARVDAFGRAFVKSVTLDREDYDAAVAYVVARFGRGGGL